ncbi:hypothetical protein ALQ26_04207 [Pseudomonas amygdali pv. lachrymans]|nr:hypothetical protein ALQ26_04207 [Pseudomonas amygdali pv. lachrymans]
MPLDVAPRDTLHKIGQPGVRQCVASGVHHLIHNARLVHHDGSSQPANVLCGGDCHGRIEAAQRIDPTALQIDDTERGFEQEACKHTGRNDYPFGLLLGAQLFSHIELLIEKILRAAPADKVVVNAELPGQVAFYAGLERRIGQFALSAPASGKTRTTDYRVVALHDSG